MSGAGQAGLPDQQCCGREAGLGLRGAGHLGSQCAKLRFGIVWSRLSVIERGDFVTRSSVQLHVN